MKTMRTAILIAILTVCAAVAAYANVPLKIEEFVAKTEQECDKYSKEDWEQNRNEYRALLEDYKNSRKEYSQNEKEIAVRAMGRYNALLIKKGIVKSTMGIKEVSALIPGFIKGLSEGLDANSGEINSALHSLVDTNRIKGALQSLGNALGKALAGKGESPEGEAPAVEAPEEQPEQLQL